MVYDELCKTDNECVYAKRVEEARLHFSTDATEGGKVSLCCTVNLLGETYF